MGIGPQELIIVMVIVVLVFGVRRLPEIGKDLGKGIRNFKWSLRQITEDEDEAQTKKEAEK